MRTLLLALLCLLPAAGISAPVRADEIATNDRKRYKGRILEETDAHVKIRTYADGVLTIPRAEIKKVQKGKTAFDQYDRQVEKDPPETAADHFELGNWCEKKELLDLAREHWRKAADLDPAHEEAHKKLGDVREGDRWIPEEEFYKAKGWEKHEGKWMPAEEAAKKRREAVLKNVSERIEMKISFQPDATKEKMEAFAENVKLYAGVIWDMTLGTVYIEKIRVYDKAEDGDCVVVSLDGFNLPDGNSGKAQLGMKKFWVGGGTNGFVWVHEFYHAWAALPDHYGSSIGCIMNSSNRSTLFKWKFCDGCWGTVKAKWQIPRPPGFTESEELPQMRSAEGVHGKPEDCGDPPGIEVAITDN